jgi:branched-chain amino acid transport system permease protein
MTPRPDGVDATLTPPDGAKVASTPAVRRWSRTASATTGASGIGLVILVFVPYFAGGPIEQPVIVACTFISMAAMWNLLAGFSGLTSFGQHAYLGVGAYGLYLVASHGINPFVGIALAAIIAGVVSIPVSFLLLRLDGGYFAVASLVIASVFEIVATLSPSVGGSTGVTIPGLTGYGPLLREALIYWAALAIVVMSLVGVYLLVRGGFGLDARAAGSEPIAAASLGVRTMAVRRVAYLVAAVGAGATGALLGLQTLYIEPATSFSLQYSVYMLFMVLVGGIGTIEGPIIGALILFALQQTLSQYGAWYLVLVGAVAVLATLVLPRGIWGLVSDRWGWSLLPVGHRIRVISPSDGKA